MSIYSSSSGSPGSILYSLTNPDSVTANANNTFTAPANATLSASTDYFVVFENGNTAAFVSNQYTLSVTETNTLDSGAWSEWGIENVHHIQRDTESWTSEELELLIAIKGRVLPLPDSIRVAGSSLYVTYGEALDESSVPPRTAYTVTVDGGAGVRPTDVSVSGRTVTLTLPSAVASGQSVTVSYAVPTSNPVQDAGGVPATAFTDEAATVQAAAPAGRPGNCGTNYSFCTTLTGVQWAESGRRVTGYDEASGHGSIGTKTFSYIDRDTANLDTTVNTVRRLVRIGDYIHVVLDKFLPNGSYIYLNNKALPVGAGGQSRVAGTTGTHRWHIISSNGPSVRQGNQTLSMLINWPRRNRSPLLEARQTIGEAGVVLGSAGRGVERGGSQVSPRGFRYLLPREQTGSTLTLPYGYAVTELVAHHAGVRLGVGRAVPFLETFVGDLVLEWAGETLPLSEGRILGGAGMIVWGQAWVNSNAPSLNATRYRSTLPVGESVGLCLRAPGQTCPGSTAVGSASQFARTRSGRYR